MVLLKSIFLLSTALLAIAAIPTPLPVQSAPEWKVSVRFPPTENRDAPARTAGGGRREGASNCVQEKTPLTALMPTNNVGTTVTANPTLFWYVPRTTAKSAEFVVVDDRENEVYVTNFALSGTPGIVKLSLPATVALRVSQNYTWHLALVCDRIDRSQDQFVQGKIRRTELSQDLKTKLKQSVPLQQAKLYAQAKIWQETLTILANLRRSNPTEWEELLRSVGLTNVARAPFVDCCKPASLNAGQ